jgi:hypothetical protein
MSKGYGQMSKLLLNDLLLITITFMGIAYLYLTHSIDLNYGILLGVVYLFAKGFGYIILPYRQFEKFLDHLITHSKLPVLSGFEIFKTTLVALLFFGFLFIDPAFWLIESLLLIMIHIWVLITFTRNSK